MSAPKIMTFFTMLPSVSESSERVFLVSFTDPNKQFFNLKSVFKFLNHGFSM